MKILLVNGYPNTPRGQAKFTEFQAIVQEVYSLLTAILILYRLFLLRRTLSMQISDLSLGIKTILTIFYTNWTLAMQIDK